ncbi:penicillin acylase family protein [Streptomyces sp. UH6]|uniref:penicillin acylase family protein n=1 Tax=Streptomyces sp. UH6 TaxID=2748379 RepID=UPI0015D4E27C|nr:penicillin acylase family protein [Streptomyces sp. UH6]NYV74131.1 penicillin acylase family protein [Streptomyces sp. UH6]
MNPFTRLLGHGRRGRSRSVAVLLTAGALLAGTLTGATGAVATSDPWPGASDPCVGQCGDILTPGENGHATLAGILLHRSIGTRPAHSADQIEKYDDLLHNYSGLTDDQLADYFSDASLGVAADQVESSYSPRSGVTITRDKATGTPHIKGTTRSDTEFGAGYAAGEDRLWLMDILRHVGRAQLSSFAGGASGNRELEQSLWAVAAYEESDLQDQLNRIKGSGARGAQAVQDITDYVAGINAFIDDTVGDNTYPGEYELTGQGKDIKDFTATDVVAIASVIGAIFGSGGGGEVENALAKLALQKQYGTAAGAAAYKAWRAQNDTEATTTTGGSFPYATSPDSPVGVAAPDRGSVKAYQHVSNGTGTGATATAGTPAESSVSSSSEGVLPGDLITARRGMSNALVVSGEHTASGHPIAVFGPQTGYYAPQLLMVQELDGPGLRSRGASFPGISFYVEIGRGLDYAWSATSANQDITDTFAVELCEPSGATPTTASQSYLLDGTCTPFEKLTVHNSWSPTTADGTAAGSYDLTTLRSAYGLVTHTGTSGGTPVAYTALRSTYHHELDSVIGFQKFNDPSVITSASAFRIAAQDIGYTFNWFYADSRHTTYYNSGHNPVRAAGTDPDQPIWARSSHEWRNWDPSDNTSDVTAPSAHPQSEDEDYYISWNNKQADDYAAGWSNGAVHRADLLDGRVSALVDTGGVTRAKLVQAMEDAAVTDLRAEQVLPELLEVLDSAQVTDPAASAAVSELRAWVAAGSERREGAKGDGTYTHANAIRILDAWWPLLIEGVFEADLGTEAYRALTAVEPINESPSGGQNGSGATGTGIAAGQAHKGSAFQHGWWSYLDKDLRSVLGRGVASPLDRTYCGSGTVSSCRTVLLDTLTAAAAQPAAAVYPGDDSCDPGDQVCADAIVHRAMGGITAPRIAWQNRPTYQQVVEFPATRADTLTNLARGGTATASDHQDAIVVSYPPGKAIDGDLGSRWASKTVSTAWITVDLKAVRRVGRVFLDWSDQYAVKYQVQVSSDNATWSTVHTTTAGSGGSENRSFSPVDARYVRVSLLVRGTDNRYSLNEIGVYSQ